MAKTKVESNGSNNGKNQNESKSESLVRQRTRILIETFTNRYLVIKTFIAVTFFVLSFVFFTPILNPGSDLKRLFIIVYGLVVIVLIAFLIFEYLLKTAALQRNLQTRLYSLVLSINTFFGLIIPLFYTNYIFRVIFQSLNLMTTTESFVCELRCIFVKAYYHNNIYWNVNQMIMILLVLNAILFIFGGLVERVFMKNSK